MATETIAANLGHQRLAGAANGVALTTTSAFTGLVKGTEYVDLIPRNFATAAVMRYIECPYLVVLLSDRAKSLDIAPTDFTTVAQDGSTDTSVDLSSLTAGRYLYVGSATRFRGANLDMDGTNSTGSTALTTKYWDGSTWASLSVTDGTSSSVSLDQDGSVTWTMPTGSLWHSDNLVTIQSKVGLSIAGPSGSFKYRDTQMYWTRWEWSHNLDATVTIDAMLGINESTAYAETTEGLGMGMRVKHGFGGIGGFEMLTNAGTGNCLVVCSSMNGYFSTGEVT